LLDGELLTDDNQGNRISQVLTGWHVDTEFTDANGQPRFARKCSKELSLRNKMTVAFVY
jgi:hypothetical protein